MPDPACPGTGASANSACQSLRPNQEATVDDASYWRTVALRRWADAIADQLAVEATVEALQAEISAIHSTLSWRITAPLRSVRGLTRRLVHR